MASANRPFSLTEDLLETHAEQWQSATQANFLLAAAEGRLPKDVEGRWLASDRLYVHAYIKSVGLLLHNLKLPREPPSDTKDEQYITQFAEWLNSALSAKRDEEKFFIDTAKQYDLNLEVKSEEDELAGLHQLQNLFEKTAASPTEAEGKPLPWLEAAVVFWGTEQCYLDAWSWAKGKEPIGATVVSAVGQDSDGGAMRKEFIPSWTSAEFKGVVKQLKDIVDGAVNEEIRKTGVAAKNELIERVQAKWKELLVAEIVFWPDVN
jgi:hypothetical protein